MPSIRTARPPEGLPNSTLDEINRHILRALIENPRQSTAELARRVGMSAPAVRERVGRLEDAGVIRGYQLDLDPAAFGLPVTAWVRVRPGPGQLPKIVELLRDSPQVSECYRISGEDCFLLKVHAPSVEALEVVLDTLLPHGQTTTSIVVATPVAPRPPGVI
jgi:Lrp/AsnC family transcriptional regulator, leucine-responsive regulatory protein